MGRHIHRYRYSQLRALRLMALFGGLPSSELVQNPVAVALKNSPFWMIVFIVLGIVAFAAQYVHNRAWEIQTYNRMSEPTS